MKTLRTRIFRSIAIVSLAVLTPGISAGQSRGDSGSGGMRDQGKSETQGYHGKTGAGAGGSTDAGTVKDTGPGCEKGSRAGSSGSGKGAGGATDSRDSKGVIRAYRTGGGLETGPAAAEPGYSR